VSDEVIDLRDKLLDRGEGSQRFAALERDGEIAGMELQLTRADGTPIWGSSSTHGSKAALILMAAGRPDSTGWSPTSPRAGRRWKSATGRQLT